MTIEKRPNGTYRVKIRIKGPDGLYVNPPDRTFKRRRDAEEYEDEVKVAVRRGTYNAPIQKPWVEYIEEYLANYASGDKVRPKDVSVRRNQLDAWLTEIGPKYITSITSADLLKGQKEFREAISPRTGEPRSNSSINKFVFTMQNFLQWARDQQLINVAPKIRQLTADNGRTRYLFPDEVSRFESAASDISDLAFKAFIHVAYVTGARAGELKNLTWGRVDFSQNTVMFTETKNNTGRMLSIDGCAHVLRAYADTVTDKANHRHVWVNEKGKYPYNYHPKWSSFRDSVPLDDFVFHDFRHNVASQLAMNRVDIARIQQFMGHKAIAMTMRYAHLNPTANIETGNALRGVMLVGDSNE